MPRTTRSSEKTTTTVTESDKAIKKSTRNKSSSAKDDPQPEKKIKKSQSVDIKGSKISSVKKDNKKQTSKETVQTITQEKKEVKVILKGSIPVDNYVRNKNTKVLVYNGVTYAATLNQSNVQQNNNKFYILQVLESQSNSNNFYFFTRWGRVGVQGQMAQAGPMSRDNAIRQYNKKLAAKTNAGDYRIVEMNYEEEKQEKEEKKQSVKQIGTKEEVKSSLDPKVQDLIRLIFDMKMMNNQMKEIGYDAKKMPLGKLAKSSIMKGYEALKKLMEEVKGKKRREILAEESNNFYSYIPHDFGFKHMSLFILDSEQKIRQKLQMLQSLEDIQIYTKLLDEGKLASDMNQLDSNYLKLNTQITPLDESSEQYKIVQDYVKNTHAHTHNQYKLKIDQVYKIRKEKEEKIYKKDIHNKQLLWHGSRLTNYVGILSQGLRIAPPEAPVTGYMFGKGVYFADMVSKSANYCFTNKQNNTGLMLLCEVALGECNQKYYADYYANLLPDGKHSTKGCGKTAPLSGTKIGDVYVPNGKYGTIPVSQGVLLYNEFIVYDVSQIMCKYLLKMKFDY